MTVGDFIQQHWVALSIIASIGAACTVLEAKFINPHKRKLRPVTAGPDHDNTAGAAEGAGAMPPPAPVGGSVGNLMVGAAEGLGGKLMRTVSFLG